MEVCEGPGRGMVQQARYLPVMLRRRREAAASKHDGPAATAGPFILRGSLRSRLRMTELTGAAYSAARALPTRY